jgi:hypothetical protein
MKSQRRKYVEGSSWTRYSQGRAFVRSVRRPQDLTRPLKTPSERVLDVIRHHIYRRHGTNGIVMQKVFDFFGCYLEIDKVNLDRSGRILCCLARALVCQKDKKGIVAYSKGLD